MWDCMAASTGTFLWSHLSQGLISSVLSQSSTELGMGDTRQGHLPLYPDAVLENLLHPNHSHTTG